MTATSRTPATESAADAASPHHVGRVLLDPPMVWINGAPQPPDAVHVSARDRGLTLADGLFETMRAQGGIVFRFEHHIARLQHGLAALGIPAPPDLRDWVLRAVRAAGTSRSSVRITVTRGVGPAGLAPPGDVHPTTIVTVGPLPALPPSVYEDGLSAHVASGRRNERAATAGLKTIAYTDSVAALLEAHRAGADEALFLDTDDHCSEATASNLFVWTGSILLTPPRTCGALPGITRAVIFELAPALGLPAAERVFGVDDLLAAEEAFLTSTLRGVAPLVRVGTQRIGRGTPGHHTRRIAAAYRALVDEECAASG